MNTHLKPTLGTLHLWGIAVGLVISGEHFGWSYGWGVAGTKACRHPWPSCHVFRPRTGQSSPAA
ncbi:hypothetical protein [Pseudomonas sp. ZS1P83]